MKEPKQKFSHVSRTDRLKTAWCTANGPMSFLFHLGYQQFTMPRVVRRVLAKTEVHRAWFGGYTGLSICSIIELTEHKE